MIPVRKLNGRSEIARGRSRSTITRINFYASLLGGFEPPVGHIFAARNMLPNVECKSRAEALAGSLSQ
jgi:hypothetical protein